MANLQQNTYTVYQSRCVWLHMCRPLIGAWPPVPFAYPSRQIRALHAKGAIFHAAHVPLFAALRIVYIVLQPNNDVRGADLSFEGCLLQLLAATGSAPDIVPESDDHIGPSMATPDVARSVMNAFPWRDGSPTQWAHPLIQSALRIVRAYMSDDVAMFCDAVAQCPCAHQIGIVRLFATEIRKYFLLRLLRSHSGRERIPLAFVADCLTLGLDKVSHSLSMTEDAQYHPDMRPIDPATMRERVLVDVCEYLQQKAGVVAVPSQGDRPPGPLGFLSSPALLVAPSLEAVTNSERLGAPSPTAEKEEESLVGFVPPPVKRLRTLEGSR